MRRQRLGCLLQRKRPVRAKPVANAPSPSAPALCSGRCAGCLLRPAARQLPDSRSTAWQDPAKRAPPGGARALSSLGTSHRLTRGGQASCVQHTPACAPADSSAARPGSHRALRPCEGGRPRATLPETGAACGGVSRTGEQFENLANPPDTHPSPRPCDRYAQKRKPARAGTCRRTASRAARYAARARHLSSASRCSPS